MGVLRTVSLFMFIFILAWVVEEKHAKLIAKSRSSSQYKSVVMRKVQRLLELLDEGRGSIELSLKDYRELVFESPRNHTTFVLFYNAHSLCESCDKVAIAFEKIARSFLLHYTRFDKKTSTWDVQMLAFFVKVRMSQGYRDMLVDIDPTEPSLFYFAPGHSFKYNQFEKMDQELLSPEMSGQLSLERMLRFIEHIAEIRIPLEKQTPSSGLLPSLFSAVLLGVMVLFNIHHFGYWNMFVEIVKQGQYAYVVAIIVIWLLSGQMFNYIRYTPMFGHYGFNIMSLIYPGMRNQYGSESIIIMVLYAFILYAMVSLVETRERQLSEQLPIRHVQGSIIGALSAFYFGFMGLQVISQIKTGR